MSGDLRGLAVRAPGLWQRLTALLRAPVKIAIDLDARDVHIYGGLLLAAIGGWQLSPAWTCIAVGIVLSVLGVFARRLADRRM